MAKFREGDLFAIPLPDHDWLTGRILLDLDRVFSKKLVGERSAFRPRRRTILVEAYSEPSAEPSERVSTILIPGTWIDADGFGGKSKPRWPIVGHRSVDPTEVDFPEIVIDSDGVTMFEKGEIRLPVPVSTSNVERWECRALFLNSAAYIYTCNHYLGRPQTLSATPDAFSLEHSDLRFSPHRKEVFEMLGADPNRSYFDWATSLGLDPGRLWT